MPKLKDPRCEAFAMAASSGVGLCEAYEDAGFSGDPGQAERLARRSRIASRIAELQQDQDDLDAARPVEVIIALVRISRDAERLESAEGAREARLSLLDAHRLYLAQGGGAQINRLTLLDDEEWDTVFRSLGPAANDNLRPMAASPAIQV